MDTAAAFEFETGDIQRRQREHEDVVPVPARPAEEGGDQGDDHFTVNLNPFGRARLGSGGPPVEPPPLAVRFIDEEQEARAVNELTAGLLDNLHAPLQRLEEHLLELHRNQQIIIAGLLNENEKLANLPHWHEIAEVMSRAPTYHQRLHNMRTQMTDLNARVQRLKVRSAKLKQRKIAVEEKERQLTAQPAASLLMRRAGGDPAASTSEGSSQSSSAAKGKGRV